MLRIILETDWERLKKIDEYSRGICAKPYMPDNSSAEYKLLAERCTGPWAVLLVNTPAQACYVDDFRPGRATDELPDDEFTPEWEHWQNSRLDSRQLAVHRGALTFGHSYTLTEKLESGKVQTKGLSAQKTAALFKDPANDDTPSWALTITRMPDTANEIPGSARMWDSGREYDVSFTSSLEDPNAIQARPLAAHGASTCPVTRFVAAVDLEGRTMGVVELMIPLLDRINQTVFDLLVAQTYASIKVRTVSGMAPPMKMKTITDEDDNEVQVPDLDTNGNPQPAPVKNLGSRLLYAEDPAVKFGTLDETPLSGFIESVDMSIRHLSAISQTPPHYLLGQIANLSAEALEAAEVSLSRKIEEFRSSFGESWERVFRLAAELSGETTSITDYSGEVVWRDMELRSLAQSADGLGKLADMLEIPKRGLWSRVPNVTSNELRTWRELEKESDYARQIAEGIQRATTPSPAVSQAKAAAPDKAK